MSKKITRDLGPVHAYALAVAEGFTGTKAEWEQLMAQAAMNAEAAEGFATDAAEANQKARQHANAASRSAQTAEDWAATAEELTDEVAEALNQNTEAMAIWARNIGDMEDTVEESAAKVEEANGYYAEIRNTLDVTELAKRINRPNLLKQSFSSERKVPTSPVVKAEFNIPAEDATQAGDPFTYTVEDEGIGATYTLYQVSSSDWENVSGNLVSAACQAGTAVITVAARSAHTKNVTIKVQLCTSTSREVPYGQTYRQYGTNAAYIKNVMGKNPDVTGDEMDDITEAVTVLTGDDIIEEADGETYTKALSFTCNVANTAWGNLEKMIFSYGNHGEGVVPVSVQKDGYCWGDLPMEVGKRYTMSCWVRVTSGTKMLVAMGWDALSNSIDNEKRKFFEVQGGTWQRISYEFIFSPEGEQFRTSTTDDVTRQYANWTRTVYYACSRKYAGTVQMCGFRLTAGRLNMNQTYDELMDRIESLEGRINELEAMTVENQGS